MSVYREFDPNSVIDKLRTKAVQLNDYQMIGDNLARVVLSATGDWAKEDFLQTVANMFSGLATPVRDSFKKLTDNVVVGFVASQPDIRPYEESAAELAKYRVVASNILMDNEDQTTWDLREGASGKYLTRRGSEDLSELAKGIRHRRASVPTFASIQAPVVASKEFVAYVDPNELELSHGYAVERDGKTNTVSIIATTGQEVEVPDVLVVHATQLMGEDEKSAGITLAANSDKSAMVEYYKKLYSYSPEYIAEIVKMINQHAFA